MLWEQNLAACLCWVCSTVAALCCRVVSEDLKATLSAGCRWDVQARSAGLRLPFMLGQCWKKQLRPGSSRTAIALHPCDSCGALSSRAGACSPPPLAPGTPVQCSSSYGAAALGMAFLVMELLQLCPGGCWEIPVDAGFENHLFWG